MYLIFNVWAYRFLCNLVDSASNLLSEFGPDGQSHTQQHFRALKEDRVPDLQHVVMGQTGGKHGQKPLHGEDVGKRRLIAAWNTMQLSWYKHSSFASIHINRVAAYLLLPDWLLSGGAGDAEKVLEVSVAEDLWTRPCPLRGHAGYWRSNYREAPCQSNRS